MMTIKDISNKLGVNARTVYRWIDDGEFPKSDLKIGNTRRWKESTVNGWLDKMNINKDDKQ
jgi:excisionase family DNA binding protein